MNGVGQKTGDNVIRDHSIDSLSDDEFARKVRKEVDVIRPKKVDILKENDGISLIFISDNKTEDLCKGGCYYRAECRTSERITSTFIKHPNIKFSCQKVQTNFGEKLYNSPKRKEKKICCKFFSRTEKDYYSWCGFHLGFSSRLPKTLLYGISVVSNTGDTSAYSWISASFPCS